MESSKSNIKTGISGNGLKLFAMICMLIDHIAASLMIKGSGSEDAEIIGSEPLYVLMRLIGRLSFPIFIFLLVEGYSRTRSKLMYFIRLVIFALISEVPFDMAFWVDAKDGEFIEFAYQNIFFTLAFGFIIIASADYLLKKMPQKITAGLLIAVVVIIVDVFVLAMGTDYGLLGVTAIFVAYLLRSNTKKMMIAVSIILALADLSQLMSLLTVGLVLSYNGKRGKGNKWLFYLFYPVHLLILGLIKMYI